LCIVNQKRNKMLFFCHTDNTDHLAETVVKILTYAVAKANGLEFNSRPKSLNVMVHCLRDSIMPYFGEAITFRVSTEDCAVLVYYPALCGDKPILTVTSVVK
jgi:hypothetical protein